ncbi:hypothetical protein QTP86_003719, partial [Hemibagrus guttatus]
LCGCGVSDEGCSALTSALRSNPSHLKELELQGNKIGDEGRNLLSALRVDEHYNLQDLMLSASRDSLTAGSWVLVPSDPVHTCTVPGRYGNWTIVHGGHSPVTSVPVPSPDK